MLKITALLMLIVTSLYGLEIKKSELFYIKKLFPQAKMEKGLKIADPITMKSPNVTIYELLTENGKLVGWWRPIATDTGCKSACLPLTFSLLFDTKGDFAGYYSIDMLTKKNHRLFKDTDSMTLDLVMRTDGPGLDKKLIPMDLIDAITMATHTQFKEHVVPDAALTTLRMLQYKRHTETWLKRYTSSGLRGN